MRDLEIRGAGNLLGAGPVRPHRRGGLRPLRPAGGRGGGRGPGRAPRPAPPRSRSTCPATPTCPPTTWRARTSPRGLPPAGLGDHRGRGRRHRRRVARPLRPAPRRPPRGCWPWPGCGSSACAPGSPTWRSPRPGAGGHRPGRRPGSSPLGPAGQRPGAPAPPAPRGHLPRGGSHQLVVPLAHRRSRPRGAAPLLVEPSCPRRRIRPGPNSGAGGTPVACAGVKRLLVLLVVVAAVCRCGRRRGALQRGHGQRRRPSPRPPSTPSSPPSRAAPATSAYLSAEVALDRGHGLVRPSPASASRHGRTPQCLYDVHRSGGSRAVEDELMSSWRPRRGLDHRVRPGARPGRPDAQIDAATLDAGDRSKLAVPAWCAAGPRSWRRCRRRSWTPWSGPGQARGALRPRRRVRPRPASSAYFDGPSGRFDTAVPDVAQSPADAGPGPDHPRQARRSGTPFAQRPPGRCRARPQLPASRQGRPARAVTASVLGSANRVGLPGCSSDQGGVRSCPAGLAHAHHLRRRPARPCTTVPAAGQQADRRRARTCFAASADTGRRRATVSAPGDRAYEQAPGAAPWHSTSPPLPTCTPAGAATPVGSTGPAATG